MPGCLSLRCLFLASCYLTSTSDRYAEGITSRAGRVFALNLHSQAGRPAQNTYPQHAAVLLVAGVGCPREHADCVKMTRRLQMAGWEQSAQAASSPARTPSLLWSSKQASGGVGCIRRTQESRLESAPNYVTTAL